MTKLDGDTRGGAALSVRAVGGCPVKFVGVGEKMAPLEPFYPERLASRILVRPGVTRLFTECCAPTCGSVPCTRHWCPADIFTIKRTPFLLLHLPQVWFSGVQGMGDVVSLVEKAQRAMSEKDAEAAMKKMQDATFDFNDFMEQARMVWSVHVGPFSLCVERLKISRERMLYPYINCEL